MKWYSAPLSEQTPPEGKQVLVISTTSDYAVASYIAGRWYCSKDYSPLYGVMYWMKLPLPPIS